MPTSSVTPTLAQAIAAALSYMDACAGYDSDAQQQAANALVSATNAAASALSAGQSVTTAQGALALINSALGQVLANATLVTNAAAAIGSSASIAATQATVATAQAAIATTQAGIATGDATSATASAATATSASNTAVAASLAAAASAATLAGTVSLQGTWNASTNSPALASGVGTKGFFYIVSTAGTTALDGLSSWNASDWAIFDGTVWRKIDGLAIEVVSVAGLSGVITAAALKTAMTFVVADISGAAPLASPTFTGVPAVPTAAPSTNTTQAASTAFVIANSVNPASPTFTGTPTAPTAAVDTNTTQIATTAMVLAQAAAATPLINGVPAVGSSTRFARADHAHPGGWTQIAQTTVSGTPTTIAFTSIPTTYSDLIMVITALTAPSNISCTYDVSTNNGSTYSAGSNSMLVAVTAGEDGVISHRGYQLNRGLTESDYSASASSPGDVLGTSAIHLVTHTGGANAVRLRALTSTFAAGGVVTLYGR